MVAMKDAIEHHAANYIAWLGCGYHKTERTVQKLVLQPALKASLTVFPKAAAQLYKSAQSRKRLNKHIRFICYNSRVRDVVMYVVAIPLAQSLHFIRYSHHPAEQYAEICICEP